MDAHSDNPVSKGCDPTGSIRLKVGPEEALFARRCARPKAGLFEPEELLGGPAARF